MVPYMVFEGYLDAGAACEHRVVCAGADLAGEGGESTVVRGHTAVGHVWQGQAQCARRGQGWERAGERGQWGRVGVRVWVGRWGAVRDLLLLKSKELWWKVVGFWVREGGWMCVQQLSLLLQEVCQARGGAM